MSEPTFESIHAGMSSEDASAMARHIVSALPGPSVTQLQSDATNLTDANTDPKIREQRAEDLRKELASAPPSVPDLSKLNETQKKVAVEKYIADKDAYLLGLMN